MVDVQQVIKPDPRKHLLSPAQRPTQACGEYRAAARLLEQMEQSGIVSTMQSNGNREILVPAGQEESDA